MLHYSPASRQWVAEYSRPLQLQVTLVKRWVSTPEVKVAGYKNRAVFLEVLRVRIGCLLFEADWRLR